MRLKQIDIKNFRGIQHLSFDELGKINVILGTNNIGKSSILEAIFMLTGMSNPLIPQRLNTMRDRRLTDVKNLKYLFYNVRFDNHPIISGINGDGKRRSVEISPEFETQSVGGNIQLDKLLSISTDTLPLTGIKLTYKNGGNLSYVSKINAIKEQFSLDRRYKEDLKAVFIPSSEKDGNALDSYSELVKRQRKDVVINALQNFDNRIVSVEILSDGLYLQFDGITELLPISMAGDGIRRFFNIISFVADPTIDIVLIDEIENGLHFSAYMKLWASLLSFVKNTKLQLFITTHNIETLECLNQLYQNANNNLLMPDLRVYTINTNNNVYSLSADGLKGALDNEIEVRE